MLDDVRNRVPVRRSPQQGLEDQQVQRSLEQIGIERSGRTELLRLTRMFEPPNKRGINVYARMVHMAGGAAHGIILSQMHYWFSPGRNQRARVTQQHQGEWWWAARYEDIAAQTGLPLPLQRFRDAHASHVRGFASGGAASRRMAESRIVTGVRRDGEEFPIDAAISHLRDGEDGVDLKTTTLGLGYEHPLSKRTSLYANLGSGESTDLDRHTGIEAGMKHNF